MITFRLRDLKIAHPANDYTLILERVDDSPARDANDKPVVTEVAYFKTSERQTAEDTVMLLNRFYGIRV